MIIPDNIVDAAIDAYRAALPKWCRHGDYHDEEKRPSAFMWRGRRFDTMPPGWRRDLRTAMRAALEAAEQTREAKE